MERYEKNRAYLRLLDDRYKKLSNLEGEAKAIAAELEDMKAEIQLYSYRKDFKNHPGWEPKIQQLTYDLDFKQKTYQDRIFNIDSEISDLRCDIESLQELMERAN